MKKNLALSGLIKIMTGLKDTSRLSVLIYHRVLKEHDYMRPDEPTEAQFGNQMEVLSEYFNPISISEALERIDNNTLRPRSVCVTFDDGYADNFTNALPVLQNYKIPACVFVSTKYLNGGVMWNDRILESLGQFQVHLSICEN